MRDIDRRSLIAGASLVGAAALVRAAKGGDINPPAGPVGPTGRSLTQIEPRTPIQSLPGGQGFLHVISQPGSYYLTGDILCPVGSGGILVTAAPGTVSIDMMCFAIRGSGGGGGGGGGAIKVFAPGPDYLEVSDGYIRDFDGVGIDAGGARVLECYDLSIDRCLHGIMCRTSALIEACHITRCTLDGILYEPANPVAATFCVDECECRACNQHGIHVAGDWSSGSATLYLSDCDCVGNGQDGMRLVFVSGSVGAGSSVAISIDDCRCCANGGHGSRLSVATGAGTPAAVISVQNTDSVCSSNALGGMRIFGAHADLMDCDCSSNTGIGLAADFMDGSIDGCTASRNTASGIHIMGPSRCSICDCSVHTNQGAGLRVDPICRGLSITECDAQANAVGFHIDGVGHTFVWNSAQDNPTNYMISPALPVVILTPPQLAASCNPHANYSS